MTGAQLLNALGPEWIADNLGADVTATARMHTVMIKRGTFAVQAGVSPSDNMITVLVFAHPDGRRTGLTRQEARDELIELFA